MPLGLLAAVFLVAFSGCIFSPATGKTKIQPPPPIKYLVRSTPQAVLHNLKLAYEARDSVGYRVLFALSYKGTSYDTTSSGKHLAGTFTWLDEVHHIQALAELTTIRDITLDLKSEGTWIRTLAFGPSGEQWADITITGPGMQIDFTDGTSSWQLRSSEVFDFAFAPETPAPTSPTDTLWTLGRWDETGP